MLDKDAGYHDGIRGQAVAVKVMQGRTAGVSNAIRRDLRLRMPLEDGPIINAICGLEGEGIGDLVGVVDVLPVRYGADDHSNVEIDMPLLQEHLDASTYSPLGTWHPVERLRRLNDLHDHGLLDDEEFAEAQANPLEDD